MGRLVIINSDDYGLSKGVNDAVVEGFKKGYISSATLMVNQEYSEDALKRWKENEEIMNIGLHFCLDAGKPLSKNFGSYLDSEGKFKRPHREYLDDIPKDLIEEELRLQLEKAESLGCKITHIDSHHHVHIVHKNVNDVVRKICKELSLPMRTNEELIPNFYGEGVTKENFLEGLKTIEEGGYKDLMCHVSFEDDELAKKTTYYDKRLEERRLLEEVVTKELMEKLSLTLGSYKDIGGK